MDNNSTTATTLLARSNRRRFLLIPATATVAFLIPPVVFILSTPEALLSGVVLSALFVPIGAAFVLIGAAYLQLLVEIQVDQVRLILPLADIEPWFPWRLQRDIIPFAALERVEIETRYNAYTEDNREKVATLFTGQGNYQLSSIWFPQFDQLVEALASRCQDETLSIIEDSTADAPTPQATWIRRSSRIAEIIGYVALLVLGILALSGRSEHAGTVIAGILLLAIARPAFQTLRHLRQTA